MKILFSVWTDEKNHNQNESKNYFSIGTKPEYKNEPVLFRDYGPEGINQNEPKGSPNSKSILFRNYTTEN